MCWWCCVVLGCHWSLSWQHLLASLRYNSKPQTWRQMSAMFRVLETKHMYIYKSYIIYTYTYVILESREICEASKLRCFSQAGGRRRSKLGDTLHHLFGGKTNRDFGEHFIMKHPNVCHCMSNTAEYRRSNWERYLKQISMLKLWTRSGDWFHLGGVLKTWDIMSNIRWDKRTTTYLFNRLFVRLLRSYLWYIYVFIFMSYVFHTCIYNIHNTYIHIYVNLYIHIIYIYVYIYII